MKDLYVGFIMFKKIKKNLVDRGIYISLSEWKEEIKTFNRATFYWIMLAGGLAGMTLIDIIQNGGLF